MLVLGLEAYKQTLDCYLIILYELFQKGEKFVLLFTFGVRNGGAQDLHLVLHSGIISGRLRGAWNQSELATC